MCRYRFCGVCKNVEKYNNSINPCTVQTIGVGVDAVIEAMKAKLYVQCYSFFFLPVHRVFQSEYSSYTHGLRIHNRE